ncbi:MAG: rhomboid family intramembrane serine protease [Deltaproteobacteria bacterium]|nr:rhomboid family intramembrane serine protease [Deltaproteobacteria bacterium]
MFIPLKDENPTKTYPYITVSIIIVNILFFFYALFQGKMGINNIAYKFGAIPYTYSHFPFHLFPNALPPPFTLITSQFVHGGFFHIAGNMLYLWIFGNNIEDVIGHFRFLIYYIVAGIIASFAHIIASPSSTIPMIGASGAIAGIMGAYMVLFPRAKILTLIFFIIIIQIVRIPAIFVLGFWFFIQLLMSTNPNSHVAWFAHIGGFLFGVVTIKWMIKRKRYI